MSNKLLNQKHRREKSKNNSHELYELSYYAFSKNKNLKKDLAIENNQNSFKKKKTGNKSDESHNTPLSFNDSSSKFISNQIQHYSPTKNEIINNKYSVFKCENIITKELYAIKIIMDKDNKYENAELEAELAKKVLAENKTKKNNFCIKIIDNFKFKKNQNEYYAIVTELLGPNLYEFIKKNSFKGYTITQIQHIAKQVLEGVAFLHSKNIVHTDLKPENILLINSEYDMIKKYEDVPLNVSLRQDNTSRNASTISTNNSRCSKQGIVLYKKLKKSDIKIIDFGSALELKYRGDGVICTRQYRPPEVILECCKWDQASDIWSIGCILVELYTGELLFNALNDQEQLCLIEKTCGHYPNWMIKNTKNENIQNLFLDCAKHKCDKVLNIRKCQNYDDVKKALYNQRTFEESICSQHYKFYEFIKFLMKIDPKKRPSAKEALKHQFFKTKFQD